MYRNIASYTKQGNEVIWLATWDKDGNRIEEEHVIKPYLYYEDSSFKGATEFSMFGKPLRKLEFANSFDRSEWIKESRNVSLFEKLSSTKQFLLNEFYGQERDPEFVKFDLRTFFFDIEVEIQNEFPEPEFANYPINVISIYDTLTRTIYVWTYKKDVFKVITENDIEKIKKEVNEEYEKDVDIQIFRFDREYQLLESFLKFWENNYPDIISGWNIDGFDMTYIINRIKKVMPEGSERRLSPINWHSKCVKMHQEQKLKKTVVEYSIMGVSICDYMNLYKKFIPKSQQSWKLDYIAKMDTGKGKLDYYELGYDSMKDFMQNDFATFVKYNIIDSTLVKQIDDSRHFIKLMRRICNMGLCEYECIFRSIPYILGALCIEARKKGVKFLTDANRDEDHKFESEGFEGAFVFDTKAGFYQNGIMSFDFNSLYPNVIMSVNMSPETMVGKIIEEIGENDESKVRIRKRDNSEIIISRQKLDELLETKLSISACNVLFYKSTVKWGIVPSFLDSLYHGRVEIKNEMKKNKKKVHELDEEIKKLEEELKKFE